MRRMQLSKEQVKAISCLLTILLLISCILFIIGIAAEDWNESAGPLLIVAAILTFFASICSFLLIFKIYRLVVIVFVFTHSFAVIFAWIGIAVVVNPLQSTVHTNVRVDPRTGIHGRFCLFTINH